MGSRIPKTGEAFEGEEEGATVVEEGKGELTEDGADGRLEVVRGRGSRPRGLSSSSVSSTGNESTDG